MVGDGALDRGFPGGISLADADGDGDLDVMATRGYDTTQTQTPFHFDRSMLYLNDGAGRFTHDLQNPLSNSDNPTSGSTWGDVDHDGDLDAFVTIEHGRPDRFYRNIGGGRFAQEELGEATTTRGSNFNASWVDIDGDGDLDLLAGGPTLEPAQPNLVFRNDAGRFVRVTGTPLENGASNPGAVLWADVDNDGDQDLFVANSDLSRVSEIPPGEVETSQIYRNDGGWRFVRTEGQGFDSGAFPAMSAAFGDIDNDGDLDLFLQMVPGGETRPMGDRLFRNDGTGRFTLEPGFEGPSHTELAAGSAFLDADLDGDLDLLFANYDGGIYLYANDGSGQFSAMTDTALNGRRGSHAAIAAGDLDGDGDFDAVIGNWGDTSEGEFATILRNESARCGRPLHIELRDQYGAPDPIGARVTLVTRGRGGERLQLREAMGQTTFRGQSASFFRYGVPNSEQVVRVDIRWPDGSTQTFTRVRFDGANVIRQEGS